jgi:hypothetical protein
MPRTASAKKPSLALPTVAKRRTTWAQRTGHATKAAGILARAVNERPEFVEDDDGHRVRVWKEEELKRYTNDDIKTALRLRRAAEREDLLEFIPERAIGYCVTKGWLFRDVTSGIFWVTRKAAAELDLPRKHQGRVIQFLDRGI